MLTITATRPPATDLGYLLHKHPDKLQTFELPFGSAHVFYPEASATRCTAAMLLEIDPIRLTRRGRPSDTTPESLLQDYVNDRPYCASSHLSVAIARVFGTALAGRNQENPELAENPMPLQAQVSSIRARHGPGLIHRLFEPLGYRVETETPPLDEEFPAWGEGLHHNLTLTSESNTLAQLLTHLYVLLPALDSQKHYWINEDETDKLLRFGKGWLEKHPLQETISQRYLGHRRHLFSQAQEQLAPASGVEISETDAADPAVAEPESEIVATVAAIAGIGAPAEVDPAAIDAPDAADAAGIPETDDDNPADVAAEPRARRTTEAELERRLAEEIADAETRSPLQQLRIQAVLEQIHQSGATTVLDLGCGEGQLTKILLQEPQLQRVTAVDVSPLALERAKRRLRTDRMTPQQKQRISLLHGSLLYRDPRLKDADAAVAMEVIEHIDPTKLELFEDAALNYARPKTLIVTTPNEEYNKLFPVFDGPYRHQDHRFEWTRKEFRKWANAAARKYGYQAEFHGIGEPDPKEGSPTQMAVLTRNG